ncbi:type 1 glutamine amidotransferase domain-containing protein [Nitrosophilus alvini]|uniref:type 1 glutamine amidotransferase domain-containing protein n=1 Tax=Nitrosophilus alvini TaxID=2714855 RepID=UPI00190DBFB0|nr:type 1 glutamine amidotransferase domain-containing protein [Nitrosophilus alvini]
MTKIAILVDDLFDEREFIYPFYRFLEEGYNVLVAGKEKKEYTSKHGFCVKTQLKISQVKLNMIDAVFIPGGYAPEKLRNDKNVLDLIVKCDGANKPIGAICHGPLVLVAAGILKNRKATGYHTIKKEMINSGVFYTGVPVEIDKNVVTGSGPSALPEFMKAFLKTIAIRTQ